MITTPGARIPRLMVGLGGVCMFALAVAIGSPLLALEGLAFAVIAGVWRIPRGVDLVAVGVFLLWTNAAVVLVRVHGALGPIAALPILIIASVAVIAFLQSGGMVVVTPTFCLLLIYGAALSLASLFAADATRVIEALATFAIEGLLLWVVVINSLTTERRLHVAIVAIVAAATFLAFFSILQVVTGTYGNDYFGFAQLGGDRAERLLAGEVTTVRVGGPFAEQNRYAQILLVSLPLAFVARRWVRHPMLMWLAMAITAGGVALTSSRGAVLAVGCMLIAMALLRLIPIRALMVAGAALVVAVLIVPGYRERIAASLTATGGLESNEGVDNSTLSRVAENIAAFDMFADKPILGVGPGGYGRQYEQYAELIGLNVREGSRQPHNLYLGIAAELGIVGLSAFLAVIAFLGLRLVRLALARRGTLRSELAAAMVASLVGHLVAGIFLHNAFERYMWLLLAIMDVHLVLAARDAESYRVEPARSPLATAGTPQ